MARRAERSWFFSDFCLLTSVTHSELAAIKPESSVELKPESSINIKRRTAQLGSNVATVCTPIMELSMPCGSVIARSGFIAMNPRIDNAKGTIPNSIPPIMKDFLSCVFLMAKERCQYCWSEMAPAIRPIEVTIPKENATPGSKMLVIPSVPAKPDWMAVSPPPACQTSGRMIAPIPKIIMSWMKSVRIDARKPEIRV